MRWRCEESYKFQKTVLQWTTRGLRRKGTVKVLKDFYYYGNQFPASEIKIKHAPGTVSFRVLTPKLDIASISIIEAMRFHYRFAT